MRQRIGLSIRPPVFRGSRYPSPESSSFRPAPNRRRATDRCLGPSDDRHRQPLCAIACARVLLLDTGAQRDARARLRGWLAGCEPRSRASAGVTNVLSSRRIPTCCATPTATHWRTKATVPQGKAIGALLPGQGPTALSDEHEGRSHATRARPGTPRWTNGDIGHAPCVTH
jgi:hypothetical protein